MPVALERNLAQKPPAGSIDIDPGEPLTQGLEFALVLNESGSSTAFEAIRHTTLTLTGGVGWGSNANGSVVTIPSSSASYLTTTNGPDDTPYIGPITCLFRGQVNTGSQYNGFLAKCGVDGGLTDTPFDFRTDNSAVPKLSIVRTGSSAPAGYDSVSTISLGTPQTYVVVAYTTLNDGVPSFYIDGVDAGAAFNFDSGAAQVTGNRYEIRVGRRPDASVQLDGNCECAYIWSRALSASEVARVTAEPYCLFLPAAMHRLFWPAFIPPSSADRADSDSAVASEASYAVQLLGVSDFSGTEGDSAVIATNAILRPTADISSGAWTATPGGALYATLDELSPDDSDVDTSSLAPSADVMEVLLGPSVATLNTASGGLLTVRYNGTVLGGRRVDLRIDLVQGTTVLTTWLAPAISNAVQNFQFAVPASVVAAISNTADLRVRFTATQV